MKKKLKPSQIPHKCVVCQKVIFWPRTVFCSDLCEKKDMTSYYYKGKLRFK